MYNHQNPLFVITILYSKCHSEYFVIQTLGRLLVGKDVQVFLGLQKKALQYLADYEGPSHWSFYMI